jgi:penicillin amidase
MRINQLLRADSAVTVDAMRRYQTDPGSARADALVPVLLRLGREVLERRAGADSAAIRQALDLLGQWDRRYTRDNTRAVFFEFVMQELQDRLWDELLPAGGSESRRIATPSEAVLLEVLQDSAASWWDDRRTAGVVEDRLEVVARSLAAALARALRELGDPADTSAWRWSRVRQANIYHLLRAPSLSVLGLPIQGGPSTINPSSGDGTSGASWRMVVELGPEVRGFGVYPGGQSGNPVSPWYADRIPRWVEGQLDTLRFPRSPSELDGARQRSRLLLVPGRSR